MTIPAADPGSFRDPGGRVFIDGERILRAVYPDSAKEYVSARDSGLFESLISQKLLVESRELDPQSHSAGAGAAYLLEHPKLPFISYPYEWPFALLKKAALFQLDLLVEALERGFTLSDATAYNVQFVGTEPRFIDHLSFERYVDGNIWAGHRQFCMQFLNPIVMWSRLGVAPNSWFRGGLEGIAPEELAPLLKWRDWLSWTILSHVVAQGALQARANAGQNISRSDRKRSLSRNSFRSLLLQLRSFIITTELRQPGTVWGRYDTDNSYRDHEAEAKHRFVRRMVDATRPRLLYDLGCNSGDYSLAALDAGADYVVGFDFDFGALERAVSRSSKASLPFLPLWMDATNPSPSQGWNQVERQGFAQRAKGDSVIALAFIHHLAISKNIPLDRAVEWIMSVAPVGVIEFPPKGDTMVQRLLARRKDIFPNYDEAHFLAEVARRGRIVASEHLSPGGRLLVWYDRSEEGAGRSR